MEFKEPLNLTPQQEIKKKRLLAVLELRLKKPHWRDGRIYKEMLKKYGNDWTFSKFQIIKDITQVERMVASQIDPKADPVKTWKRYMIEEMCLKAYERAEELDKPFEMIQAANTIGRHNLTDKEDVVKPPFEDIIPFVPEITNDVSVLGIKPMGKHELEEKKVNLLKKFGMPELIEDVKVLEDETED